MHDDMLRLEQHVVALLQHGEHVGLDVLAAQSDQDTGIGGLDQPRLQGEVPRLQADALDTVLADDPAP